MARKTGVPRSVPPGRDASGMRQRALELDLRAAIGTTLSSTDTGIATPQTPSIPETYRQLIVPLLQMEIANSGASDADSFKPQDFADVARTFIDFVPFGEYMVVWCGKTGDSEGTNILRPRFLDPADDTWKDWSGTAPDSFTDADTVNIPDALGSSGAYTYRFWKSGWFPLPETVSGQALWIGINDSLIGDKESYLLQIHLRGGTLVSSSGVTDSGGVTEDIVISGVTYSFVSGRLMSHT